MKRVKHYTGFSLVELLMAMAISAILLTGLAAAFSASMTSYTVNKDTYEGLNNTRLALARMVSELRSGYWIDPDAGPSQCNFFVDKYDENGVWQDRIDMGYDYRSADKILYLVKHEDDSDYVLCRNVESATFTKTPTADGNDCQSVHIDLTVRSGAIEQAFSQSVTIRRSLE
ncbi:MAG: prepilin-type N-terminal cleavage/methylation domain-containing protein [Phycisphaerae bacterium]|nr:prepilin-type N-terminal cleavage/methylation domain-containing protein [Phycisphaerae bacterium]